MSSKIRLAYNNTGAADGVTLTASSALAGFPASNAVDPYRSLKWKPTGSFRIDATNNKIYINDGSPFTATLTSAVYTTGALMAAQVQTQLNAVSSNWTCTYSTTTGLFTIDRSAGTKTLVLTTTTAAAWDTLGFTGVADQNAAAADVRRNHTSERLAFDLGVTSDCPFFAAYGTPDEQFTIPDTATCVLKANSTNDYDTAALTITMTATNSGIFNFEDTLTTDYRYWWFDFSDPENPDGPETYALKIWLGDYVTPTDKNLTNGFRVTVVDPSIIRRSPSGVQYALRRTKYTQFSGVSIQWVSGTDRTIFRDAFDYCGMTKPIFVSIDPDAAISSGIDEFTKLMYFDRNPETGHQLHDRYSFDISFTEVVG